jgi:hypothetical protein
MTRLLKPEVYAEKLRLVCKEVGTNIVPIEGYKGRFIKSQHKCLKCNYEWNVMPQNFLHGKSGCPSCSGINRIDKNQVKNTLKERFGANIKIKDIKTYVNKTTPCTFICKEHGKFKAALQTVLNRHNGCPKCNEFQLVSEKEFKQRFKKKYSKLKVTYVSGYTNMHTKCTFNCPEHGNFEKKPERILSDSTHYGCKRCGDHIRTQKRFLTTERFIERVKELHGEEKFLFEKTEYISNDKPVTVTCPKHGDFSIKANYLMFGVRGKCPKCSTRFKTISIQGKDFIVEGHEPIALEKYLIGKHRLDVKYLHEQKSGKVPEIMYRFKNSWHLHLPDFYYEKTNTIYEVKGEWSIGKIETDWNPSAYAKLKAKAKFAEKAGYKYMVLVVQGKKVFRLPSSWHRYSKQWVFDWLRDLEDY